jgi:hypothetical protein
MEGGSIYTLQNVPGKGKGLVATETIPKGTQILEEQPIITTPECQRSVELLKTHISQQVHPFNEHEQESFLSLHNLYPYKNSYKQYFSILQKKIASLSRTTKLMRVYSSRPVASTTTATTMHKNTRTSAFNGALFTH